MGFIRDRRAKSLAGLTSPLNVTTRPFAVGCDRLIMPGVPRLYKTFGEGRGARLAACCLAPGASPSLASRPRQPVTASITNMTTATLTTGEIPVPSVMSLRKEAAAEIERLIAFLDATEPDPDIEGDYSDDEPDQDGEPSLGSINPTIFGTQQTWASGSDDDREDEHSGEEPDVEEGSLGWTETVHQDGVNWHGGYHGDLEDEHDGREPDVDLERSMGWRNEGAQTGGWYQDHPELEAGSPEWPAEHPTWQPPKHRVVAPPVPVIPMSACVRVSA